MNKENVETNSRYKYCRRLMEVEAVKVSRGNLEKIVKFTGMGDLRFVKGINPFEKDLYFLVGSCFNVPEGWYFVKYQTGEIELMNPQEFKSVFEPKDFIDKNTFSQENMLERMNILYGKNIPERFSKLTEEYHELLVAADDYIVNGIMPLDNSDILDELADLNAVLFHIAKLFGYTQDELLEIAFDKILGRYFDPNYKRKHPHIKTAGENEYCGSCKSFKNEDLIGTGYYDIKKETINCCDCGCENWENKNVQQYKHFENRFNKKI